MRPPSLTSRLVRRILLALYKGQRWTIAGKAPDVPKYVLVGAPHSRNGDFITFLGVTDALGIHASFIGKHGLFHWPMGRFMKDMGGIPVDRGRKSNYVEQVIAEFARRDTMALVIAPEGSRTSDGRWRSGFYHIAMGAGVPVVPAWIDPEKRIGRLGAPIVLSGDQRADMRRIADFYRQQQPDNPRFAEIDRALDGGGLSNSPTQRQSGRR